MTRTRTWAIAVVVCGALAAGTVLAQTAPVTSGAAAGTSGAPPARIYNPVAAETLGIASSAEQLRGSYVKLPDLFYDGVTNFPNDVVRAGITPKDYTAFLTRPDGSNLICFVPRMVKVVGSDKPIENPDLKMLLAAQPVRGTEIYLMGTVGARMFVGDGNATAFAVDRVVLGHEEPKAAAAGTRKPVKLTIERFDPEGKKLTQEFTIPNSGQRYRIPDPADPQNTAKDLYITLQF